MGETLAPFLDLLAALVRAPSVVGCEAPFFRVLQRELELHGARVRRFQGVLEARGDQPESLIVSAHADRHGMVCTGPDEFQYAAYAVKEQGDLDGNSISEQTVHTIAGRFTGDRVEAYDPWHGGYLGQGHVTSCYDCALRGNLVFEIPELSQLSPGTPVGYLQHLELAPDAIAAQLDNVLGVALAVDLFRRGFRGTALFTAEEEAGRSWRYLLSWFRRHEVETQRLLVLDTSPYPDERAARQQDVALRHRDANGVFAERLVNELEATCRGLDLAVGFKDQQIEELNQERAKAGKKPSSLGRTELGRVVAATRGVVNGATLQIPTTGYHTNHETATLDAVRAALAVTGALVSETSR